MNLNISGLVDALLAAIDMRSVLLASLIEKFLPVLPSYVLFPAIGMGASDWADLLVRCLVATVGSVGGAAAWYAVGASVGPARVQSWVVRYGRWVFLKPALYDRLRSFYQQRPFPITFFGQMVPTVRIFQALPAGVLRLPLLPFLTATALGTQFWIIPLTAAGYLLRRHGWSAAEIGVGLVSALLVIEGMVFAIMLGRARWRGRSSRLSRLGDRS